MSHDFEELVVGVSEFSLVMGVFDTGESVDAVVSLSVVFAVFSELVFQDLGAFFDFSVVVSDVMLVPGVVFMDEEVSASFPGSGEFVGGLFEVSPDGELAHFVGHECFHVGTVDSFQVPVFSPEGM